MCDDKNIPLNEDGYERKNDQTEMTGGDETEGANEENNKEKMNEVAKTAYCPLLQYCRGRRFEDGEIYECDYVEKQVYKLIKKGECYTDFKKSSYLTDWLWFKSNLGIMIVKEILGLDSDDPRREKYYGFLGIRNKGTDSGMIQKYPVSVRSEEEVALLEQLFADGDWVQGPGADFI